MTSLYLRLYLNPSTMYIILNCYWAHFDKGYIERKSNWCMKKMLFVTIYITPRDWELQTESFLSSLSLYAFTPVWRTTFKTPGGKFPNLLEMKLTTNVILLFLSAVNTDIFVYFLMLQVRAMKLTESTNTCCTSDTVVCTIKVNIKVRFMANDGFLLIFMRWMDYTQRQDLLLGKFRI